MKSALLLRLPWPPSFNDYWRPCTISNGRVMMVLTKRAREYKSQVLCRVRETLGSKTLDPIVGRVRVEYEFCAPDRRRRDIFNFEKGLSDSLTAAGVWLDDEQIDEGVVRRGALFSGGCANVLISEL